MMMRSSSETVDTRRSDLVPFKHCKNESYTQQKYPLGKKGEVKKFSDEGKQSQFVTHRSTLING